MTNNLSELRAQHRRQGLSTDTADPDPMNLFRRWHAEWAQAGPYDPAAAVLATVNPEGQPSARLVDIAEVDTGFVFLTRYDSRKGLELSVNDRAALCFVWIEADRQVRVEGRTQRLDEVSADGYFGRLPRPVQMLARASDQSAVISDPGSLHQLLDQTERHYAGVEVPRSRDWGGYRLVPDRLEFWQGRIDGVPDRLRYRRQGDAWQLDRLMP